VIFITIQRIKKDASRRPSITLGRDPRFPIVQASLAIP